MQWIKTIMAICSFLSWGCKCSTHWSSQNVGSLTSALRENLDLSLKEASCPRNGLSTYLIQAIEELTPSLTSTAAQRIISLFLYWAGPSPGCGGIIDDSEKPNLSSESEPLHSHKPPFVFSPHSQVHSASQHCRMWVSPISPCDQLPITIGLTYRSGYNQGSFPYCKWQRGVTSRNCGCGVGMRVMALLYF